VISTYRMRRWYGYRRHEKLPRPDCHSDKETTARRSLERGVPQLAKMRTSGSRDRVNGSISAPDKPRPFPGQFAPAPSRTR